MPKVKKKNDYSVHQNNKCQFTIRSAGAYKAPLKPYNAVSIGRYMIDRNNDYVSDNVMFPKIKSDDEIKFPLDLNVRFETHTPTECTGNNWMFLLKWICEKKFDLNSVDVVLRRGDIRKMADTLFDYYKEPWSYKLCRYQNTVYFNEMKTAKSEEKKLKETERDKRCQYWGLNFERLVTEQSKDSVEEMPSYYSVVKSQISKHRVLMRAEIDCTGRVQTCSDDPDYIELKTALEPATTSMERNFKRNKLSKVWLQSYLFGIGKVVYGFRDHNGNITSMKHFQTSELPKLCENYWSAGSMMSFLQALLNWALPQVKEGYSSTLTYSGSNIIVLNSSDKPGHFLPDWFVEFLGEDISDKKMGVA